METIDTNNTKERENKIRPSMEEKNAFLESAKKELQKIIDEIGTEHRETIENLYDMINEFSQNVPNKENLLSLGDRHVKINGFGKRPTKEISDLYNKLLNYIENF